MLSLGSIVFIMFSTSIIGGETSPNNSIPNNSSFNKISKLKKLTQYVGIKIKQCWKENPKTTRVVGAISSSVIFFPGRSAKGDGPLNEQTNGSLNTTSKDNNYLKKNKPVKNISNFQDNDYQNYQNNYSSDIKNNSKISKIPSEFIFIPNAIVIEKDHTDHTNNTNFTELSQQKYPYKNSPLTMNSLNHQDSNHPVLEYEEYFEPMAPVDSNNSTQKNPLNIPNNSSKNLHHKKSNRSKIIQSINEENLNKFYQNKEQPLVDNGPNFHMLIETNHDIKKANSNYLGNNDDNISKKKLANPLLKQQDTSNIIEDGITNQDSCNIKDPINEDKNQEAMNVPVICTITDDINHDGDKNQKKSNFSRLCAIKDPINKNFHEENMEPSLENVLLAIFDEACLDQPSDPIKHSNVTPIKSTTKSKLTHVENPLPDPIIVKDNQLKLEPKNQDYEMIEEFKEGDTLTYDNDKNNMNRALLMDPAAYQYDNDAYESDGELDIKPHGKSPKKPIKLGMNEAYYDEEEFIPHYNHFQFNNDDYDEKQIFKKSTKNLFIDEDYNNYDGQQLIEKSPNHHWHHTKMFPTNQERYKYNNPMEHSRAQNKKNGRKSIKIRGYNKLENPMEYCYSKKKYDGPEISDNYKQTKVIYTPAPNKNGYKTHQVSGVTNYASLKNRIEKNKEKNQIVKVSPSPQREKRDISPRITQVFTLAQKTFHGRKNNKKLQHETKELNVIAAASSIL